LTDKFIELLLQKINEHYTAYYEEAPNNAKFPYCVVPTLQVRELNKGGYSGVFDIEVYNNELSDISVETISDTLRTELNGFFYIGDLLGYHIGFSDQLIMKSTEADLIIRRVTFEARIFTRKGN